MGVCFDDGPVWDVTFCSGRVLGGGIAKMHTHTHTNTYIFANRNCGCDGIYKVCKLVCCSFFFWFGLISFNAYNIHFGRVVFVVVVVVCLLDVGL